MIPGFFVYENHTLGVWFKKASAMRKTKKLLLRRMEVRSANCTNKSKRRSFNECE